MGRRVKKTTYDYNTSAWQLEKEVLFVYDGWNVVEEITAVNTNTTSKYYVWGLDLSQSRQDAGGVGGLIATIDGAITYYHFYDVNGNVGQLVNGADGSIAASYQYAPYGKLLKSEGVYADANAICFSTKYGDSETGLIYYGYRYYESILGRWLSKDPIGEEGGLNVYSIVQNNIINMIDPFGLEYTMKKMELSKGVFFFAYEIRNPNCVAKTDIERKSKKCKEGVDLQIIFIPTDKCCSDNKNIKLFQIGKAFDLSTNADYDWSKGGEGHQNIELVRTKKGYFTDVHHRNGKKGEPLSIFPHTLDWKEFGKNKILSPYIRDFPGDDTAEAKLSFETCAACTDNNILDIYGCLTWRIDLLGKSGERQVILGDVVESDTPSGNVIEAVNNHYNFYSVEDQPVLPESIPFP